jgi:hypothetical protein
LDTPDRPAAAGPNSNFELHWGKIKQIGLLFGLLLASSLFLGIIGRFNDSPWSEAIVSAIDALIVIAFASLHYRQILPLLGLPKMGGRLALRLLAVAIGFAIAMTIYFALLQRLGVPMLRVSDNYRKAGWGLWAMLVLVSLTPAVVEELAFRGVIQSTLESIFDRRDAWIIQAALFSVLHLSPIICPSHFIMGLCFGYLRLRSKSLYPGIILHGSWNALVLFQELYWP